MKNLSVFLLLFAMVFVAGAQIPRGFNYQAIIRNDEGNIMAEAEMDVRFTLYRTIFQQSDITDYRETQVVMTNEFGLINVVIGQGISDIGTWSEINWVNFAGFTDRFLRVEMDFGNGWLELSDDLVRSVPYANFAEEAVSLIDGAWSPEGNYDTDDQSFLGTIDDDPLILKTANTERLTIDGSGKISLLVNNLEPTAVIQNISEESFEANLRFDTNFSGDGARVAFNAFGFGLVHDDGGSIILDNTSASFTLNTAGSAIIQAGYGEDDEARLIVRDGTDTDVANANSGFVTLGYTNAANVCMDTNEIMARDNGAASELYLNAQGGGVVLNSFTSTTHTLYCNGTAAKPGGGSWTATSDARLKENVLPYSEGLEQILKVEPVTYHYTSATGHDTATEHVGVIAQDLQKISPDMVTENELELTNGEKGNYLAVDPSAFTYMLINAVQELSAENAELRKRIEMIESRLNN